MALLEINDLRKTFPTGEKALNGIDLSLDKREIVALLGLSGSGKSTLLRIMAGVDKDFTGEAWAAEGAKASRPELDFVRAGLEAGHGGVLLCRAEDKLVGYLWWVDTENCPYGPGCYAAKEPFLWVHTVYTIPSFRRRGVARALHHELEKIARRLKRASIWLDVYANNPISQKLHDNLGFLPVTVVQKRVISL